MSEIENITIKYGPHFSCRLKMWSLILTKLKDQRVQTNKKSCLLCVPDFFPFVQTEQTGFTDVLQV